MRGRMSSVLVGELLLPDCKKARTATTKVSDRAISLKMRSWRRRRCCQLRHAAAATTSIAVPLLPPAPTSSNPNPQMNIRPDKTSSLKKKKGWPGERPEEPQCDEKFWLTDVKGPAALSLIYAWIMENPHWLAVWVNGYKSMKWDRAADCTVSIVVGGHYRRRAHMGKCPFNLAKTCSFDRGWSHNTFLQAPLSVARERWTKDGVLIPREQRMWVWH